MNSMPQLTFTDADLAASIPERFYQVLQQLPADHVAYVAADESLTYQDLAAASQGLALALIAHLGKATEPSQQQAVALLLPHDSMALIGIYGTLFAGHFYFPLDLLLGELMLRQILADCPPKAMVTTTALRDRITALLPADHNLPILCVDTIPWAAMPLPAPQPCDPQMYACIQYTSGSTGKPRGVIRTHATNLYSSYLACHDLGVTSCDRTSHLFSYAHAFSAGSIFGGLLNGATLHARTLTEISPLLLYQWIEEHQITALTASIGLLRSLADLSATHPPLLSLRSIGTGGEVMTHADVDRLCQLLSPACRLVIRLASTEAGTYARFIIEAGKPWQGERTPSGYAPYGQEVMILDEQHQPVAADQIGEIAVRSRFVCVGYWNRPAENADKFLPSPNASQPPLFLTGDRGRMAADGLLEHLGRIDFMVKIRGFRVEPETIEQALMTHPALYECVVVARPSRSGESRLIAYLVARSVPAPSVSELRELLAQSLPDYMIPARFVYLQTLPRNVYGKLQRQSLPAPGAHRPDLAIPFVAPRNEAEQKLADMWAELLDLDEVGMDDNFFELGGDSLTAMRMIVLIKQQLGFSVPTSFFRTPTPAKLVALLNTHDTPKIESTLVPAARKTLPATDPANWALSLYGKGTGLSTKIRRRILLHGPLAKGITLPYAIGNRLQRTWLRQMVLHSHLFDEQSAVFQRCCAEAGVSDLHADLLITNLMTNTWVTWRSTVLTSALGFANWVTINGYARFKSALDYKKGVIIVFAHQGYSGKVAKYLLRRHGIDQHYTVGNVGVNFDLNAPPAIAHTMQAHSMLQSGGIVLIAGEGRMGAKAITVPFHGRNLPLPAGFAELAFLNQAPVLAIFETMAPDGRITLDFTDLPTPRHNAEIKDSLYSYSNMLTERWPHLLPTTGWGRLKYITGLPATLSNAS